MRHELKIPSIDVPWTIVMDQDGTEDIAIILDSSGSPLARSRMFWRPTSDDGPSETWDSIRLMRAAPELYHALQSMLNALNQVQPGHPACESARLAIQNVSETPESMDGLNRGYQASLIASAMIHSEEM